jgi:hypothetical protein
MTTIVTRAGKGSPLTNTEVDANFTNLNTAKIETLTSTDTSVTITGTGSSRDLSVPVNPAVVSGPASSTDNAVARFDSTTGKLIQNSVVTVSDTGQIAGAISLSDPNFIDFNTGYATALTEGQLGWDGTFNSLSLGMVGGNVIQHIGEDTYIYVKASAAITKGQVCMFTGSVGASGVITAAPATGVTNGQTIIGVAAESMALNDFGLIQTYGELRSINTSAFADGDILYYNSAVTGGFTTTLPSSGPIVTLAAVVNSSVGGGIIQIRVSVTQRITASTAISVSQTASGATITNTAPDQTVALASGTGISVTGTYPSFTVTNTLPSSGGTVTSVTGTAPVVSSGGNTPDISMAAATTSVSGYLTSTDWTTFNNKYSTGGALNTPSSGTLTNCTGYTYANLSGTVPTWNQNTTGSSASCTGNAATATTATTATTANALNAANAYTVSTLSISSTGPRLFFTDTDGYAFSLFNNANVFALLNNAGSNLISCDTSGNFTATANITAYSDERVKTNWRPVQENFVEKLAQVKSGIYDRTDIEATQAGASAQDMQKLLPEVVQDGEHLSLAYGNAALVAAIELAKQVVELKKEIELLKAR